MIFVSVCFFKKKTKTKNVFSKWANSLTCAKIKRPRYDIYTFFEYSDLQRNANQLTYSQLLFVVAIVVRPSSLFV